MEKTMDKIIALAKARGFVYPGSEIYGGLANTWDYGNLGVELKNNVKRAWWQKFIQESPYNVGVDCAILMNPQTWVASGHLGSFSDPLMDCKECHERFRADKIIEDYSQEHGIELESSVDGWSQEEMKNFIEEHNVPCPSCGKHNFRTFEQQIMCCYRSIEQSTLISFPVMCNIQSTYIITSNICKLLNFLSVFPAT